MSVRISERWWRRLGCGGVVLAGLLLLAGACFGENGGGLLIEEETPEVTRTPFFPRSPVAGTPTTTPLAEGTATPPAIVTTPAANVTPVTPFEVTVSAENSGLRIREAPNTNAAIIGQIFAGDRKRVSGEVRGEEAEPGKGDLWYALEGGGFVYAPLVEKVEGGG